MADLSLPAIVERMLLAGESEENIALVIRYVTNAAFQETETLPRDTPVGGEGAERRPRQDPDRGAP